MDVYAVVVLLGALLHHDQHSSLRYFEQYQV